MAIERIFAHFKDQSAPTTSAYDPNDPESYKQYLKAMMADARDYETAILAVDRMNAQMYYYGYEPWIGPFNPGQPYIGEDPNATLGEILDKDNKNQPNRSTFVSTDVRDAVMMMLPSLVRLFAATEAPVYLVPRSEAEADVAEQATDYVNYTIWHDNAGFLALYGAFKDALTVKTGFLKWWTDDVKERQKKKFLNISAEQIQMIISEGESARLVDLGDPLPSPIGAPAIAPMPSLAPAAGGPLGPGGSSPPMGPPGGSPLGAMAGAPAPPMPQLQAPPPPPPIYEYAVIEFEVSKPIIKVAGVPPEEMRLDRYARTFRDSRIVGHERIVPVDQLIAMGYDRELCLEHIQTSESTFTTEPQLRNPGRFMGTRIGDGVKYGEWYVKIDKDGDGHPELRHICTFGDEQEIVSDEDANRVKFALFSCDPIAHTIVGDSLADYTEDIQRIKTNMMRAILDSAAESINPKTVINELIVTVDDALNDDLGAVIRTRGTPADSVMFTNTPFLGQQALPVVEMLNAVLQRRTGLSDAAKGLDPKALQSSTMLGVEAVINGAQERIELVARVLCETGFKDLFSGIFNEICENPNQKRTLKMRGKYVPYDTSTFDASMSVEVNANLGKGSDMVRMLALNQIKMDQQNVFATFGPGNPMVGIPEMLNTISDMLSLANIKNVGRYFRTPTPQQLAAIQNAPKPPDPATIIAQAQMEKVRMESAKAVSKQNFDTQKLQTETGFKYDQLHTDAAINLEKIKADQQKAGTDHTAKMGALAGQLMKTHADIQNTEQQGQLAMSNQQNQNDQVAQQGQQAQNDAQLKAAQIASQHMQAMAKLSAQHTQAMTNMATQHHAAMTGHAANLRNTDAKLVAGALTKDAELGHDAEQADLSRKHESDTTKATLGNQVKLAQMKPKPK